MNNSTVVLDKSNQKFADIMYDFWLIKNELSNKKLDKIYSKLFLMFSHNADNSLFKRGWEYYK